MAELFSLGSKSAWVAKSVSRLWWSALKLLGVRSGNGSRTMVTESKAMALSVTPSVWITGGAGWTVNVASLLVTVSNTFATTQRNFAPLSAMAVLVMVKLGLFAPEILTWFLCH